MPKQTLITEEEYNHYNRLRRKDRLLSDRYQNIRTNAVLLKILTDAYFDISSEHTSLYGDDVSILIYSYAQQLYELSNDYQLLLDS